MTGSATKQSILSRCHGLLRVSVNLSPINFQNEKQAAEIHLDGRPKSNFRISAAPRNPVIVSASCRISLFGSPK